MVHFRQQGGHQRTRVGARGLAEGLRDFEVVEEADGPEPAIGAVRCGAVRFSGFGFGFGFGLDWIGECSRFVSFRFVSFRFVSFRFVSFRCESSLRRSSKVLAFIISRVVFVRVIVFVFVFVIAFAIVAVAVAVVVVVAVAVVVCVQYRS